MVEACRKLKCQFALIDGEVIVRDKNGLSGFAALRAAIEGAPHRLVMFAFDLLWLEGQDLRRMPLFERREKLRRLLPKDRRCPIQFSEHYEGDGAALFKHACAIGLEGIVSKRALSPYKSGPAAAIDRTGSSCCNAWITQQICSSEWRTAPSSTIVHPDS